jgi:hypothetical protein
VQGNEHLTFTFVSGIGAINLVLLSIFACKKQHARRKTLIQNSLPEQSLG